MENAGRGATDVLVETVFPQLGIAVTGPTKPIVICCGRGNNGGDGFVIARHLDARGLPVRVVLFADPGRLTGDAAANFEIVRRAGLPLVTFAGDIDAAALAATLAAGTCLVDALLGTGSHGEPRPPLDSVIAAMNHSAARTVAIDLPSGLDCDTGAAATHTVRAAHTITFVAAKPGFLVPAATAFVGQLHIVDLGLPQALWNDEQLQTPSA
jgi:NAD(P)H-hydrate epimerase